MKNSKGIIIITIITIIIIIIIRRRRRRRSLSVFLKRLYHSIVVKFSVSKILTNLTVC